VWRVLRAPSCRSRRCSCVRRQHDRLVRRRSALGHGPRDSSRRQRLGLDLETEYPVKGQTRAIDALYDGDGNRRFNPAVVWPLIESEIIRAIAPSN
jgi:hypothetical protein